MALRNMRENGVQILGGDTMGAKSQNFIATAILIGALMLACTAEAAPRKGSKQIVQRANVFTAYRHIGYGTQCLAYNSSPSWVCAAYDVYPTWNWKSGEHPVRGTVSVALWPNNWTAIAGALVNFETPPLQCKLRYAVYRPANISRCP
jgi:hypothetical protein